MRSLLVSTVLCFGLACAPGADESAPEETPPAEVTQEEDVQQELTEAYEAVRDYSHAQREELARWSRERLEEVKSEIENLEKRMEDASGESREAWEKTRETLRNERETLEQRIAELQDSSSEAWDEVKSATLDAMRELERRVDEAMTQFGDDEPSSEG